MKRVFTILPALIILPTVVNAHSFRGDAGFMTGVYHPVLGFDHLMAMLCVGIVSAQIGGASHLDHSPDLCHCHGRWWISGNAEYSHSRS